MQSLQDSILENVLGTLSTVLWTVQLVPQVIHTARRQTSEGISVWALLIWIVATIVMCPFYLHIGVSVPLIIQPHAFAGLCFIWLLQYFFYGESLASWFQTQYRTVTSWCKCSVAPGPASSHGSIMSHSLQQLACQQADSTKQKHRAPSLDRDVELGTDAAKLSPQSVPARWPQRSSDVAEIADQAVTARVAGTAGTPAVLAGDTNASLTHDSHRAAPDTSLSAHTTIAAPACDGGDAEDKAVDDTSDEGSSTQAHDATVTGALPATQPLTMRARFRAKLPDMLVLVVVVGGAWVVFEYFAFMALQEHEDSSAGDQLLLALAIVTPVLFVVGFILQIVESVQVKSAAAISLWFLVMDCCGSIFGVLSVLFKAGPVEVLALLPYITVLAGQFALLGVYIWFELVPKWTRIAALPANDAAQGSCAL